MDIKFFDDGVHQGSGLGSSDNGPVPQPGPFAVPIMPVAPSGGTPIEPDSKIDGLADQGFDANGATTSNLGNGGAAPNADSIPQPATGQKYPTGSSYPS